MRMKPLDQWPFWARAAFWNACVVVGVYVGFASSRVTVTPEIQGYIAVFVVVFANLMFLSVRPRIVVERAAGRSGSPWRLLYDVLAMRPLITGLLILQLIRLSQAVGAAILFWKGPTAAFLQDTPNAQAAIAYFPATAWFMTGVALIWLLSAVGVWKCNLWAWWLALALNGWSVVSQLLKLDKLSIDPLSVTSVVLLLLPRVRVEFFRRRASVGTDSRKSLLEG